MRVFQLVGSGAAIAKRVATLLPHSLVTTINGRPTALLDQDALKKSRILIEYGFHCTNSTYELKLSFHLFNSFFFDFRFAHFQRPLQILGLHSVLQ